jgi:hypothetical protein
MTCTEKNKSAGSHTTDEGTSVQSITTPPGKDEEIL